MRVALLVVSIFLIAMAVALEIGRQNGKVWIGQRIKMAVNREVVWRPDAPSRTTQRYRGPSDEDAPYVVQFYMYTITNLAAVRNGEKPRLDRLGPYTFHKVKRKIRVKFSIDNTTVSFRELSTYIPLPRATNGSLDDSVTTLNLPLIGAIEAIHARFSTRIAPWLQFLARLIEGWGDSRVQGLFTTRTVAELLFGYEDALLARAARLLPSAGIDPRCVLVRNMTGPLDTSDEDDSMVHTGVQGGNQSTIENVLQYIMWHGQRNVSSWNPPFVETVSGTDGSQFSPGLQHGDRVQVWAGEAYRSIEFVSEQHGDFKVGNVPVIKFRPDPAQKEPDPRYYQYIKGLMNITSPESKSRGTYGPYLFLSLPGYCGVDDMRVVNSISGINCNDTSKDYDVFLDVEPTTGITLGAEKALMMSSWFGQRYKAIDSRVADDTFLPIFWAKESTEASPKQLKMFNSLLYAQAAERFFDSMAGPLALVILVAGITCLIMTIIWSGNIKSNGSARKMREDIDVLEAEQLLNDGDAP